MRLFYRLLATFFLVIPIVHSQAFAQQLDVAFEDGALGQHGFRAFLGERNGQLYVLQGKNNAGDKFSGGGFQYFEFRLTGKLPLLLARYDKSMKLVGQVELKFTPPKATTIGFWEGSFMNENGEIFVFYSARDEVQKGLVLYACVYEETGKPLVDSRGVDIIPNGTISTFQIDATPDSSMFNVYKTINRLDRVAAMSYRLIPENLTRIIHQNLVTPGEKAGEFYSLGSLVNDSGSVVIPLVVRPTAKDRKEGIKENYISFLSYDFAGKQELLDYKLGENISTQSALITLNKKQHCVISGIYLYDKAEKTHQGLFMVVFDMEKQKVVQVEIIPLTSVFAEGSPEAKRHDLDIKRIWWNEDGSALIALEHDINSSISSSLLELREAYVLKLKPDMSFEWITKVPKAQNSRENYAASSFESAYDGSTVYLLWNDHPDNLGEVIKRTANTDNPAELVPVIVAIDAESGKLLGRKQAFDKTVTGTKFLISRIRSLRRNSNQVGIYASDGKNFRLGWATLKR